MKIEILIDALRRLDDNLSELIRKEQGCPFCQSSAHRDGSISHDEDCSIPYLDAALAEIGPEAGANG
jgi:hypothetical protein